MKKFFPALAILLLATLTSCDSYNDIPETIELSDQSTYRTGFYGDLYLNDYKIPNTAITVDGRDLYSIESQQFDLLLLNDYESGYSKTIYCLDEQWHEAKAYYENPSNFTYYYQIGNIHNDEISNIIELHNLDIDKYTSLMEFGHENDKDPFSLEEPDNVRYIPITDYEALVNSELHFFSVSNDNLFTTSKGTTFHIIDGALVLTYVYDFDKDGSEQHTIIDVPTDLSEYFVELLK